MRVIVYNVEKPYLNGYELEENEDRRCFRLIDNLIFEGVFTVDQLKKNSKKRSPELTDIEVYIFLYIFYQLIL